MHSILPLPLFHVWAYLQTQPLLGLTATLCVWEIANFIDVRAGRTALTNPTVVSIVILAVLLLLTRTSYQSYFAGAVYIHFLLGPATVALAVPMYANWPAIRENFLAIFVSLTTGSIITAVSAMLIARALGAPKVVVISLGPKSVTTPIAMGIAQNLGTPFKNTWDFLVSQGYGKPETRRLPYDDYGLITIAAIDKPITWSRPAPRAGGSARTVSSTLIPPTALWPPRSTGR